jgi:hypothetical protein
LDYRTGPGRWVITQEWWVTTVLRGIIIRETGNQESWKIVRRARLCADCKQYGNMASYPPFGECKYHLDLSMIEDGLSEQLLIGEKHVKTGKLNSRGSRLQHLQR